MPGTRLRAQDRELRPTRSYVQMSSVLHQPDLATPLQSHDHGNSFV